jgi:murein L,D-transpeptidase YcbB/YkuD
MVLRVSARVFAPAAVLMTVAGVPALAQGQAGNLPQSILPSPNAPEPTPNPPPPATQTVVPVAPVAAAVPLPTLSPAQAAQLRAALHDAAVAHGLRAQNAAPPAIPEDNDALVRATLDYARAVHSGRLDKADFASDWGLRPAPYDPLPSFADAVARDRIGAWLASLPPPYAGYDALQKGLAKYRALRAAGGWKAVPAGPDLAVGAKGARVLALRQRLRVEDAEVVATGDTFDAALKAAVQRAQRRYGLNPTGTVSTGTLAALNVPVDSRIRQIMANLERWRWLPPELQKDRVQVNIAAAVLTVFDGDQPIMSMKGVTGRPGDGETPMLQSSIHSVVLNPPWNVPDGIAKRELFPKGAGYLKANGFRVIENPDGSKRLQQRSEQSALGKYKFDFDNPYAVYLHDTPTQATFSRFDRLASHGCIRLEKPAALAELLLSKDPAWGADKIQAAVGAGKTLRVKLPNQVAVYLLYWTAYASANGTMNFRDDPYQWDGELADKIEKRAAVQAVAAR